MTLIMIIVIFFSGVYCREVGAIKNAVKTSSGFEGGRPVVGSSVVYKCSANYVLEGSSSRKCEQSGIWSGEQPRCIGKYNTF